MKITYIDAKWEGGVELHISDTHVKWTVDGRWHRLTFLEFKELLRNHGKPKKQKRDSR